MKKLILTTVLGLFAFYMNAQPTANFLPTYELVSYKDPYVKYYLFEGATITIPEKGSLKIIPSIQTTSTRIYVRNFIMYIDGREVYGRPDFYFSNPAYSFSGKLNVKLKADLFYYDYPDENGFENLLPLPGYEINFTIIFEDEFEKYINEKIVRDNIGFHGNIYSLDKSKFKPIAINTFNNTDNIVMDYEGTLKLDLVFLDMLKRAIQPYELKDKYDIEYEIRGYNGTFQRSGNGSKYGIETAPIYYEYGDMLAMDIYITLHKDSKANISRKFFLFTVYIERNYYKEPPVSNIEIEDNDLVEVYTLQGKRVGKCLKSEVTLNKFETGIYIVTNKKTSYKISVR